MNLQQLRYIHEAVRCQFNLTEVAKTLHTSQPAVSKAIIELEEELGLRIFSRYGKRVRGLTETGKTLVKSIETIVGELDRIQVLSQEYAAQDSGQLAIAMPNVFLKSTMPELVQQFQQKYPKVRFTIAAADEHDIIQQIYAETIELGIVGKAKMLDKTNEWSDNKPYLNFFPCMQSYPLCITPSSQALMHFSTQDLNRLHEQPIATYPRGHWIRDNVERYFKENNVQASIVLETNDEEVIKHYVHLGLAWGIVDSLAFRSEGQKDLFEGLEKHTLHEVLGKQQWYFVMRKNLFIRQYLYTLMELIVPDLNRKEVEQTLDRNY